MQLTAAAESPPPTTVNPGAAATASATARVPAANGSSSNAPIGPFQNTVPASAIAAGVLGAVFGPMSSPIQPSGTPTPSNSWRSASAENESPRTRSCGQPELAVGVGGELEHALGELHPLLLDQRVAGPVTLGAEEAEAHRAADQDPVGGLEEALDHPDLVGDLGAAEDDDERPCRVVADRGQLATSRSSSSPA